MSKILYTDNPSTIDSIRTTQNNFAIKVGVIFVGIFALVFICGICASFLL